MRRRAGPSTMAAVDATLASTHDRRRHADGSPPRRRRLAGRGVDDVVQHASPAPPAAGGRAGRGQATVLDGHHRAAVVGRGVVAVGDPDDPAVRGRWPGHGDVAAEADEHPGPRRRSGERGGAIGAPRLGRGAEVELHTPRYDHRAGVHVELDGLPAGDAGHAQDRRRPVRSTAVKSRS